MNFLHRLVLFSVSLVLPLVAKPEAGKYHYFERSTIPLVWKSLIDNGNEFKNTTSGVDVNRFRTVGKLTIYSHLEEDMATRFALRLVPALNTESFKDLKTLNEIIRRLGPPTVKRKSFSEWSFISVSADNRAKVVIIFAEIDNKGIVVSSVMGHGIGVFFEKKKE